MITLYTSALLRIIAVHAAGSSDHDGSENAILAGCQFTIREACGNDPPTLRVSATGGRFLVQEQIPITYASEGMHGTISVDGIKRLRQFVKTLGKGEAKLTVASTGKNGMELKADNGCSIILPLCEGEGPNLDGCWSMFNQNVSGPQRCGINPAFIGALDKLWGGEPIVMDMTGRWYTATPISFDQKEGNLRRALIMPITLPN